MPNRVASKIGTLTIPISDDESNIITVAEFANLVGILFYSASAYTGTVSAEVAWAVGALAAAHQPLYYNATAVTLTGGAAEYWSVGGFRSIMLDSDGTEAAERVVEVVGIFDLG